jgi:hypothetical protein
MLAPHAALAAAVWRWSSGKTAASGTKVLKAVDAKPEVVS